MIGMHEHDGYAEHSHEVRPDHLGIRRGSRPLTRQERIRIRHLLQELSEHARSVRNAMDPVSGMHTISVDLWQAQLADLTAELRTFTERLEAGS